MLEFKKAKLCDIDAMQELVKDEVKKGIILPRSNDEIATNIRSYLLCFYKNAEKKELVAHCALHFHAKELAEIRSLITKDEFRSQGIGSKLVTTLIEEAREYGIKTLFTLTYQESFFKKLGFVKINKTNLPSQKIWADCIKCKHFPICNEVALIYEL